MHEFGIAQGILETVLAEAVKHEAKRVTAIELLVGEFNNVVEDALRFNLEALSRGTLAEGAELAIKCEALELKCGKCGKRGAPQEKLVIRCPHCGSIAVEVTGGEALNVVSIEVA